MAVSRDIEKLKKKAREAVQKTENKQSGYTFTPKAGSTGNSFSDIPKQETPKETVKVEAPKRTFTPSTVMGNSFSSLPKQTQAVTRKKTFTPSTVMEKMARQTRENTFVPRIISTVKTRANTPRFTSGENLPNLRAVSGTVSTGTRQELSKFFNTYNAVIRSDMGARQKRATIQRMIGNHSDLFRRYENETGKRFDIAAVGSEYGDINRRADQERRDSFFNKKLQNERSIIPQAVTFYGDYIRKNGDYDKISNKYAGMSGGKVDEFLKSVKPYSERPPIEYKDRNTQRYTDGLVKYYTEDGQAVDLYVEPSRAKNEKLLYMTDEERNIYAALLNERDEKTADDFLDRLSIQLDQRRAERMSKNTADKANRHKVLSGAVDIIGSFAKGLSLPEVAKQSYKQANSDIDTYRPFNPYNSNFDALTQTRAIKEGITRDMSNFGKTVTDFTLGLGENAARIPLGPAGLYIMGAGVAAETAVNQGVKGETNASNAFLTGVAYGAVEVATEKISLDSLMSIMHAPKDEAVTGIRAILKSIAKNAPKQAGYEASEEALSNIADNIADRIINGDKSEYEEYVRELMNNGASESKARKAAFWDKYVVDTIKDAAGGAASGAIFGTGGSTINGAAQVYDNTTTIGQEIKNAGAEQSVVDTGLQSDEQTGTRKYAERLQNKQGKGKHLTDWNVGRQFIKNVQAIENEEQFINSLSGIVPTEVTDRLYDDKGNELNGQYIRGKQQRVDVSANGDMSIPAAAKHEFTHAFKQIAPTAYQAYENYVINAAMETNAEAVNNRLQFLKDNYGYSDEVAREEVAAELTGAFNTKAAEKIASGNVTLADNIVGAIRTAKAQIRTAYSKGGYTNSKGVQLTFEQLNNAEKLWNKALSEAANGGQMQTDGVVRNSIVEINGRNGNYGKGVYLDTNIFDGIHPRNWNKTLTQYVYDNLAGTELTVYDDNGNAETISFAKRNERATKDGANNSHRVIDKLARTKGNANILSVVHIDELLQTAKDIGNVDENSHQWLDDKGWNYRKAYVQDKNGNIYETVLNIAKARDGRNILYALSNTKKIDEGVVPSTRNSERGSLTNRQSYNNIISENEPIVKKSVKENTGNQTKTDSFKNWFGDWENDPDNASKVVNEDGTPKIMYHGTLAQGLHEFKKEFIGSRYSYDDTGFFFISRKTIADDYATSEFDSNKQGEVISAYLDVKNPFIFNSQYARNNGYGNIFTSNDVIDIWDTYQSAILDELEGCEYDGIIIDDGTDQMVVVFEPTQIKSATDNIGTFDPNNADIRYSIKESNEYTPNKVARRLIDEYGARGNVHVKDIQDSIQALSSKVSGVFTDNPEQNYPAFEAEARSIAEKIADSARVTNDTQKDEYNELRKFLKDSRVRITDELKSDIPDFNSYRNGLMGLITFSNDGTPIDSLYKDLQERFPQYFDETTETTQSDQLTHLADTLRGLKNSETAVSDTDHDAMVEELTGRIVSDAINIAPALEKSQKKNRFVPSEQASKQRERFVPNADINEIVNSDMTDAEKRKALEDRVHFIPRGGRDLFAEAQQKGKEHFDKMHKVKESDYSEDDWKSYGEDFGTENMRRDMGERVAEAERRDREKFEERFNKAFPENQNSRWSEEDWDNLTEPVSDDYDWTKDGRNWDTPGEKQKTSAELDAEADETVKELMEERGVDSPDKLAEKTVSREDTKKRNAKFYRTKEGIQTLGSRLYTDVVDDMHPFWNYNKSFETMQTRLNRDNGKKDKVHTYGKQNPYKMAMNAKDASSRSAYLVTDYLTDFDGNVLSKGLIDTLAEGGISKEDYGAFNEYLVANHALEWLDEKGGGKYKTVYEDDRLNNWRVVKKMVDAFERNHPNFKQAAENIYDWQRQLLKAWLVDTGVITQDQYNYLTETYPHYVPFYRETNVAAAGGNTGLANLDNPIKAASGGRKRILNPIENIMYNAASYVNHASKHAVTKAAVDMYDILDSDPANNVLRAYWEEIFPRNPQDLQPTQFVKKGETESEIMDATEDAPEKPISTTLQSQVGIRDGVVSIMDNGTMRYFQVHDKDFLNVLDNVRKGREGLLAAAAAFSRARAALLTSFKPQFALVTNPIRDFGTYLVNSSDTNKVKAIGAAATSYADIARKSEAYRQYKAMGGEYSSFTTEGKNELKKALQKLSNENPNVVKQFFGLFPKAFGAYESLGNMIETAPRLGEFKSTLNKGYDIHEAFYRAKDVTVNFSRGGKISKGLNAFSNFFNAAIQGSDKFFRQAKNNPTSMAVGMAGLALISLLKYGWDNLMKDDKYDEAWKDLSNYQKNNNWNFYIGGGRFVSIPKPRENAVLITAGEAVVDKFMGEQDDRFKGFLGEYMLGTFFPDGSIIGISDYMALKANKDYRGVPIVSKTLEDLPKELQFDDNTTYFAKWLGQVTKQSPKQIDYVMNNNLGVLGTANKTYFSPNGRKDKAAMYSFGLSNTFLKDAYYSTDMANRFYNNKEDADKQADGYPSADADYLNSRYSQAGNVMGIINQMAKDNSDNKFKGRTRDIETNRWFKRAYTNYAADYKDNPLGLSDEIYKEIKGLYDEDKSILELPKIYGELKAKIDGVQQTYKFDDPYKVMQYQKDLNNAIDSAYREVIKTAEYQTMDDSDKVAALKKAKTDAANIVKEMYVSGNIEGTPQADGVVEKPTQQAMEVAQAKKDRRTKVTDTYVQQLSDDFTAANPGKEGYGVDTMMKIEPKKVKVGGKEYEVSGETANKIAAAAEDKFYDNIESFYSGDTDIDYLIGRNAKTAKYAEDANGKRVYMTGSRYNADGSKRFDETVEGKIIFKLKEAAINAAAEEYADEIMGRTSSVAGATPSPQGEGLSESAQVSSTRFRSTRRSSGGGRHLSGTSRSSGGSSVGRGVSVAAANVSESTARHRALEQIMGRGGGNPTIAKAIRGLKIEPIKPLKL